MLMITKGYMLLFLVENFWLRQVWFHLCGQVQFLFRKQFVHEHFCALLQKTMEVYVILAIG